MRPDTRPGYEALTGGAGVLDLSARGRIRVSGEDRARLLHAMTTNHVQQLKPGEGLYAFFLNAQGRILADANVLCFEGHLLLDTEPGARHFVLEHLDRYVIADDVTLDDSGERTFCLGVEGPRAFDMTGSLGLPCPRTHFAHSEWGEYTVSAISGTGMPGVRIFGPASRREELLQSFEGAGAIAATEEDLEQVRLRNHKPRFGIDFGDTVLPQEAGQSQALHFQKGCYLGQEIVERIRSRGHVNRTLMGFRMKGADAPPRSAPVNAAGKSAGEVTSSAVLPDGTVHGLAFVRVPHNRPGALVEIAGAEAELFAAPEMPELS